MLNVSDILSFFAIVCESFNSDGCYLEISECKHGWKKEQKGYGSRSHGRFSKKLYSYAVNFQALGVIWTAWNERHVYKRSLQFSGSSTVHTDKKQREPLTFQNRWSILTWKIEILLFCTRRLIGSNTMAQINQLRNALSSFSNVSGSCCLSDLALHAVFTVEICQPKRKTPFLNKNVWHFIFLRLNNPYWNMSWYIK